jgi:hypothetical protein
MLTEANDTIRHWDNYRYPEKKINEDGRYDSGI